MRIGLFQLTCVYVELLGPCYKTGRLKCTYLSCGQSIGASKHTTLKRFNTMTWGETHKTINKFSKYERHTPKDFAPTISRLLTLSSEYFSSFVHTTCTLLVSRVYLALGVVYHPLVLQFQTTRLYSRRQSCSEISVDEAFTLYGVTFQKTYENFLHFIIYYKPQLSWEIRLGLRPVHSPLLRPSLLVSFPALNDMLKFSA